MRERAKILACVFVAFGCFNDVACYNPYRYNPSFFPTQNANSYSAMGDVDWAKRSSFAEESNLEDPSVSAYLTNPKRTYYTKSYKYRQPYMRARPSYDVYAPYQAYTRYGAAFARPQTRKLSDKQYRYASMADADWGWKKRSQLPALLDLDDETLENLDDGDSALDKRNVASLAKTNSFQKLRTRSLGKRTHDENVDDNDALNLTEEEKRHISSLVRAERSLDKRLSGLYSGVRGPWGVVGTRSSSSST